MSTPTPVPVTFSVEPKEIGPAKIAAWVFPPARESLSEGLAPMWLLCIPGATYRGLAYFDRQVPGFSPFAYSMARVLAAQGICSVVIDNLGTGDSPLPPHVSGWQLTLSVYADAYRQLTEQLRELLACGTLVSGLAPLDARRLFLVGVGHSMGAMLAIALQASYPVCDALCLLGFGATIPFAQLCSQVGLSNDAAAIAQSVTPAGYLPPAMRSVLRAFFYSPAVPAALKEADEQDAVLIPAGLLALLSGNLAEDQARIRCPLFLGFAADREATAQPQREPEAYANVHSLTLFVQSNAYHCANFEPTRFDLWDEIAAWLRHKAVQARGGGKTPLLDEVDLFATGPLAS